MAKKHQNDPSTCQTCGALVSASTTRQHRDWHMEISSAIAAVAEGSRGQADLLNEHFDSHAKLADLVDTLADRVSVPSK